MIMCMHTTLHTTNAFRLPTSQKFLKEKVHIKTMGLRVEEEKACNEDDTATIAQAIVHSKMLERMGEDEEATTSIELSKIMEHTVKDAMSCDEDTKRKRATVPIHTFLCCKENSNRKSVGKKRQWKSTSHERVTKFECLQGNELLPGIPNDITLELIVPKLSWRAFHVLYSVSFTWQKAIQSHLVHGSRVRSQSLETLAIVAHHQGSRNSYRDLSVYSPRNDTWYKVPHIPHLHEGILPKGQCVSLDGELYILGGLKEQRREHEQEIEVGSKEVYILDLAGRRQWKKCADMLEPRLGFGCSVIDGKIYVFGGTSHNKPVCGSEMYDPKVNTWSPIEPMMSWRFGHDVIRQGQELLVHGGEIYYRTATHEAEDKPQLSKKAALDLEVYDPAEDTWRTPLGGLSERHTERRMIRAQGKNYLMTKFGINLYDIDKQALTHVQSFFPAKDFGWALQSYYTIVVDDELLALTVFIQTSTRRWVYGLMRSRGFGKGIEDIVWERCGLPCTNLGSPQSMWAIEI